jgi:hypothetical protein
MILRRRFYDACATAYAEECAHYAPWQVCRSTTPRICAEYTPFNGNNCKMQDPDLGDCRVLR